MSTAILSSKLAVWSAPNFKVIRTEIGKKLDRMVARLVSRKVHRKAHRDHQISHLDKAYLSGLMMPKLN